MSSIIQQVSFQPEEAKTLPEKLAEHLGIHHLTFVLDGGECIEGIPTEIGKDYISVISGDDDFILPMEKIRYFKYRA